MDRVYARLLTMSILLSLCGAGFAVPGGKPVAGVRDVMLAVETNGADGLSVRDVKRAAGAETAARCGGFRRQLGMARLRLALSGFSVRFASWCKRSLGVADFAGGEASGFHLFEVSADLCGVTSVGGAMRHGVPFFFPSFCVAVPRHPLAAASPSRAGPVCA